MNIQRKNSAHHFRMQSEREQTLVVNCGMLVGLILSITYITGGLLTSIMQVQKRGH